MGGGDKNSTNSSKEMLLGNEKGRRKSNGILPCAQLLSSFLSVAIYVHVVKKSISLAVTQDSCYISGLYVFFETHSFNPRQIKIHYHQSFIKTDSIETVVSRINVCIDNLLKDTYHK